MSIHKKILEIQSTIEVQKTGYDERHGYSYYKAEDTLNAVRDAMSQHGIIARPRVKDMYHEASIDSTGRYRPHAWAVIEYIFMDVEDGSEHSVEVIAEGSSVGDDKSSRKLFTQAQKIAFLQTFLISEDNSSFDSDNDKEMEPIPAAKPVQEKIEAAASVADLTAQIGELVKSGTIEASTVNKVGQRISDKVLGEGVSATAWRKDSRVLQELAQALKNGEVE